MSEAYALMYQRNKDLLLTVRQNLSAFFGNTTLLAELRKNADFRATAKKQIAICRYLESLPDPTETDSEKKAFKLAAKYADNFRRVTGEDPGDDLPPSKDIDDLSDDVTYVGVMIKNIFGKKIEDFPIDAPNDVNLDGGNRPVVFDQANQTPLASEDKAQASASANEEPLKGQRVDANTGRTTGFGGAAFGAGGLPNFGMGNNPFATVMGMTPDRMVLEAAKARLTNDINAGRFFRYTHKYKVIPMMYLIAAAAALFFALTALALIIAWIVASSMGMQYNYPNPQTNERSPQPLIPGFVFSAILGPLFSIVAALFLGWRMYRASIGRHTRLMERQLGITGNTTPNDNIRYYFRGFPRSAFVLFIIYIVLSLTSFWGYSSLWFLQNKNAFIMPDQQTGVVEAIYVLNIVYLVSIAPYIIVAGIGLYMNPKEDYPLIERTLTRYADEIRTGQWRPDTEYME